MYSATVAYDMRCPVISSSTNMIMEIFERADIYFVFVWIIFVTGVYGIVQVRVKRRQNKLQNHAGKSSGNSGSSNFS